MLCLAPRLNDHTTQKTSVDPCDLFWEVSYNINIASGELVRSELNCVELFYLGLYTYLGK